MTDTAKTPSRQNSRDVVVVGAGFCGLAAAYELTQRGLKPTVIEAEVDPGGLAGSFRVGDTRLERFYHHWFTNDLHLMELVAQLGLTDHLIRHGGFTCTPEQTGVTCFNADRHGFSLSRAKQELF